MPRKAKAAAPPSTSEDVTKSILEHFGMPDKEATPAPASGKGGEKAVDVEALAARIAALEADRETLRRANTALMARPADSGPPAPKDLPGVDLTGLPDKDEKPDEYVRVLNERISRAIQAGISLSMENERAVQAHEAAQTQRTMALWEQFKEAYPMYAKHQKFVEVAATEVAKRAKAKGVDVDKYMFGASEQFFADVDKEMRAIFEEVSNSPFRSKEAEAEESGGEEAEEDDAAPRTSGIFGGQESGGKPVKGAAREKPGDMIKDLQDVQRASGFF